MVRWCWIWLTVTNGVASSRWAKVGVSGAHLDPWNWGNTYLAPRSYPPRKPTWQYRKTSNHEWRCTCIDCISYFFKEKVILGGRNRLGCLPNNGGKWRLIDTEGDDWHAGWESFAQQPITDCRSLKKTPISDVEFGNCWCLFTKGPLFQILIGAFAGRSWISFVRGDWQRSFFQWTPQKAVTAIAPLFIRDFLSFLR